MEQLVLPLVLLLCIYPTMVMSKPHCKSKCVEVETTVEEQKANDTSAFAPLKQRFIELGFGAIDENKPVIELCEDMNSFTILDLNFARVKTYIKQSLREMYETVETTKKNDRAREVLPIIDCLISATKKLDRDVAKMKVDLDETSDLSPQNADFMAYANGKYKSIIAHAEKQKVEVQNFLGALWKEHTKKEGAYDKTQKDDEGITKANGESRQKLLNGEESAPDLASTSITSSKDAIAICNGPKSDNRDTLESYITNEFSEMSETMEAKMDRARQLLPIIECLIKYYRDRQRAFERERANFNLSKESGRDMKWMSDILANRLANMSALYEYYISHAEQLKQRFMY